MKIIIVTSNGLIDEIHATEPCEVIVKDVSDDVHQAWNLRPQVSASVIPEFQSLQQDIDHNNGK